MELIDIRTWLDAYLNNLMRATLASSALFLAGCGGIDAGAFSPPECDTGKLVLFDSAPDGVDYAAAYQGGFFSPTMTLIDEIGVRCGTATDADACNAASGAPNSGSRVIVTSKGDTTKTHTDGEIDALIGPVESAEDAVALVWARGFNIDCSDGEEGGVRAVSNGFEVLCSKMTSACDPIETTRFVLHVTREGTVQEVDSEVLDSTNGCVGRRPPGLRRVARATDKPVGAVLAEHARLEAASVPAFHRLAAELRHHGAPRQLVDACREAAADEIRHARIVSALAERRGARPQAARVANMPLRPLVEVATDNAVEGCVRETWGALLGLAQAHNADARDVRGAMGEIAHDEIGHAALSFAIHAWARTQLPTAQWTSVRAAQRHAANRLVTTCKAVDPAEIELGMPQPAVARQLARKLTS